MPVRLNGSTSGYVEVTAPAVAGANVITLPAATGTAVVNGANSAIVSGTAVASTSGTNIDFTGIPSWVKRITVMFQGVSTNGTSNVQIQLGTSSGATTSGYTGSYFETSGSLIGTGSLGAGFILFLATNATAAATRSGVATFVNITGNSWAGTGGFALSNTNGTMNFSGFISLASQLDRVRITTVNGTDTFDAGTINILYE